MRLFLSYLRLLGCAGAMAGCVWVMRGHSSAPETTDARRIAELEEEVARLRTRIALSATAEETHTEPGP